MSKIITNFEKFLEKHELYSNSKIKSIMNEAIKHAMGDLKKKVKESKTLKEIHELASSIPNEIMELKKFLQGTIIASIQTPESLNEQAINEANAIAIAFDKIKKAFRGLGSTKQETEVDKAKKRCIQEITEVERNLLAYVKEVNLDAEKASARMAKYQGKLYEPKFLI